MSLLIEAPLSVAFNSRGNPVGRPFERQGSQHRYWYEGLGCLVMTSALYLLRALKNSRPRREIRPFEGFVSFKPRGTVSSHCADVEALRAVVFDRNGGNRYSAWQVCPGFVGPRVVSLIAAAGMNFGTPPAIQALPNIRLLRRPPARL